MGAYNTYNSSKVIIHQIDSLYFYIALWNSKASTSPVPTFLKSEKYWKYTKRRIKLSERKFKIQKR